MRSSSRGLLLLVVISLLLLPTRTLHAQTPDPAEEAARLLSALPWPVVSATVEEGTLSVCLDVPREALTEGEGMGAEAIEDAVAHILTPVDWQTLHVLGRDEEGECRPLSDLLGSGMPPLSPLNAATVAEKITPVLPPSEFPRSLAGKVVFVSAGHGWEWNGYAWKTQRPPYQEIVEDHNNAEAVDQYLIPYLERAGAIVIPVREQDWNENRVIVDDTDVGFSAPGWTESANFGYGTHYRFAPVATGEATLTAQWQLNVPADGRYALYAWVPASSNRAPDAHYLIHHAGGTSEIQLDQRLEPSTWRYLGTFPFYAGTATVELSNLSNEAGTYVVADALRLGGGLFNDLAGIETTASSPPYRPWWESCTFYYSQWMGLDPDDWAYQNWDDFNDVVARPMYARWRYSGIDAEAVYISWHTNGWDGSVRGTESYIHDGSTYPVTPGSAELQDAVHSELIHDIRTGWDPTWVDRGKKARNLGEVRLLWDADPANRIPGVLIEIAYHDNPDDAAALKEPLFNQLAARAIYQGIVHYFEEKDGVDLAELPEPPTHLHAQNLGDGSVRIAWQPSPTDAVGLVGDPATAYRLYLSEDGFGWGEPITVQGTSITLSNLPQGTTRYFYVTAINDGGESFPSEVLGFRVGDPSLLIINGFDKLNRYALIPENDPVEGYNLRMWVNRMNRRDYVVLHGQALPPDIAWDSASNEAVRDGLLPLSDYSIVDWLLGEESSQVDGALDATERSRLNDYLANGGTLLLSGSEWAWWLNSVAPDFLHETLHAAYVADDANTYTAQGRPGSPLAGTGAINFDAPDEYDANYPDVLMPYGGSTTAMEYVGGTGGTAALSYDDGSRCLLLFGFPLEVVRPSQLPTLMGEAINRLRACTEGATVTIEQPTEGSAYPAPPAFFGSAAGPVARVEVEIERATDGADWSGSDWQAGDLWLTANGSLEWSYALPTLGDGDYTLRARPIETDGSPGQQASVRIQIDTHSPAVPVLLAPENGVAMLAVAPLFQWTEVTDDGSPIHYRLRVDGKDYEVNAAETRLPLHEGTHTWQVQAVDEAGNISEWSEARTLTLTQHHAYLPIILRNLENAPTPSPTPTPTPPPITPTPTPAPCTPLLNSGFESDEDGWSFGNAVERSTAQAHGGSYAVKAGLIPGESGGGTTLYSSIYRTLTLPAQGTTILTLWLVPFAEEGSGDLQYVILKDASGLSHTLYSGLSNTQQWEEMSFELSAYNGQSVTLYIGVMNDGDDATAALYVDDITVAQCP